MSSSSEGLLNINRRQFIAGLVALGLAPVAAARSHTGSSAGSEIWLSAQGADGDHYGMSWYRAADADIHLTLSHFRGHGSAVNPIHPERAIMIGRQPGFKGIAVDLQQARITHQFDCQEGHQFFGHACFSADGKTLYTTEGNIATGEGLVVARDANTFQILGQFSSHGIGPHELRLMPDGKSLVVANGGLLTRPQSGNQVLNPGDMDSSLVYLASTNGELLEQVRVPEPKASIRHLDLSANGEVAMAMQMQRFAASHAEIVPLGAVHSPGQAVRLLAHPEAVIGRLQDYMGSVAISNASRTVGFTSPKGNLAVFWNLDSGEYVGHHKLLDVCGLAVTADQQHFILSSSIGQLRLLNAHTLKEEKERRVMTEGIQWDNHLLVTTV
ncbi:DUF1513 domain-containing protein [Halioxenophilus sp. WMMB6]|uniref:DUF1513 domain-containing protein n=1 Tax=Halioxenophilus sp. WMMB6 TaxID=3073815 RepID=UPI00295F1446|nr:DUF1513 domain-containing protein [Halioxenophilus sp. WMMB6]